MGIREKLAAIEKLKAEGSITESQYVNLVKIALEEVESVPDQKQASAPDLPPPVAEVVAVEKKLPEGAVKKIAAVVAASVVIFFAVRVLGSSDPIESKEYKELLSKKSSLISKKSELNIKKSALQSKVDGFEDIQFEIEDYEGKINRWEETISAVRSNG